MLAVAETKRKHPRKFQCDKVRLIIKLSNSLDKYFCLIKLRNLKFSVIKNLQQIKNWKCTSGERMEKGRVSFVRIVRETGDNLKRLQASRYNYC